MIEIDGSMMEGGGQLLRMATSYSAILGEPIHVTNIRASRQQPGLKPQHLTTLQAATKISKAKIQGAYIGSSEIVFKPDGIRGGEYHFDIGTAGSISLLLQCLNPILLYADKPSMVSVIGGTAVNWSPPIPFLEHVLYPALESMGVELMIQVERHGFYPKGGGEIKQHITPVEFFEPFRPGDVSVKSITGISLCGALPEHVAVRQAETAEKRLKELRLKTKINYMRAEPASIGPGSFLVIWFEGTNIFMGSDSVGARGRTAEEVGDEAAKKLIREYRSRAHVDRHTGDHLILPASLADGESVFKVSEITLHTLTAIEIAKIFTGARFKVKGSEGEPGTISVQGIGLERRG